MLGIIRVKSGVVSVFLKDRIYYYKGYLIILCLLIFCLKKLNCIEMINFDENM